MSETLEPKPSAAIRGQHRVCLSVRACLSVCLSASHHVQQQVHRLSVTGRHLVRLLADLQQARGGQLQRAKSTNINNSNT